MVQKCHNTIGYVNIIWNNSLKLSNGFLGTLMSTKGRAHYWTLQIESQSEGFHGLFWHWWERRGGGAREGGRRNDWSQACCCCCCKQRHVHCQKWKTLGACCMIDRALLGSMRWAGIHWIVLNVDKVSSQSNRFLTSLGSLNTLHWAFEWNIRFFSIFCPIKFVSHWRMDVVISRRDD